MLKQIVVMLLAISLIILTACGATSVPAPVDKPAADESATAMPADDAKPADESATAMPADDAKPADESAQSVAQAPMRTFVIVPEQSTASYIVDEEFFGGALDQLGIQAGMVNTIGRTQAVSGQMELDLANLAQPVRSSQFSVDLSTLTSDQPRRDNRIRQANLESATYPLATFTITGLENAPVAYSEGQPVTFRALGNITIREITQPVAFDATATLSGNTITGTASTRLKMTDFGFDPPNFANLFAVGDEFTAQVEYTFQAQ